MVVKPAPKDFVPPGVRLPGPGTLVAMATVEHAIPCGSLSVVEVFYREVLGLAPQVRGDRCVVTFQVGLAQSQTLEFFELVGMEQAEACLYDTDYDSCGYHVCIYLDEAHFEAAFHGVSGAHSVYINPQFGNAAGNGASWEEARTSCQFRVKDIRDPQSGMLALVLEHEIRCPRHAACPFVASRVAP
uniref:VOC domain-containing protein n=1 Tax=Noctiluca scintillans TaxID=2966 RepID=A0A7S0ZVZ2_NOCSC